MSTNLSRAAVAATMIQQGNAPASEVQWLASNYPAMYRSAIVAAGKRVQNMPSSNEEAIQRGASSYVAPEQKQQYYNDIKKDYQASVQYERDVADVKAKNAAIEAENYQNKLALVSQFPKLVAGAIAVKEYGNQQNIPTPSPPPPSVASQYGQFVQGGGVIGALGFKTLSQKYPTSFGSPQADFATGAVASAEGLFYGTGSLVTAIPTMIQERKLTFGHGWEMFGLKTPALQPTVSGALMSSGIESVVKGTPTASGEWQALSQKSPAYMAGGFAGDILGMILLGKGTGVAYRGVKGLAGELGESAYGGFKTVQGFTSTLAKKVAPKAYYEYEYFTRSSIISTAQKVSTQITEGFSTRLVQPIQNRIYYKGPMIETPYNTLVGRVKANLITVGQRLPEITKPNSSEAASFMYSVVTPNLRNYGRAIAPSLELAGERTKAFVTQDLGILREKIVTSPYALPFQYPYVAAKEIGQYIGSRAEEAWFLGKNVVPSTIYERVTQPFEGMKTIFTIPSSRSYANFAFEDTKNIPSSVLDNLTGRARLTPQEVYEQMLKNEIKKANTLNFRAFETQISRPAKYVGGKVSPIISNVKSGARKFSDWYNEGPNAKVITQRNTINPIINKLWKVRPQTITKESLIDPNALRAEARYTQSFGTKSTQKIISITAPTEETVKAMKMFSGVPKLVVTPRSAYAEEEQITLSYPKSDLKNPIILSTNAIVNTNRLIGTNQNVLSSQLQPSMYDLKTQTKITNIPRNRVFTFPTVSQRDITIPTQIEKIIPQEITIPQFKVYEPTRTAQAQLPKLSSTIATQQMQKLFPKLSLGGGLGKTPPKGFASGKWYLKKHRVKTYSEMLKTFGLGKAAKTMKRIDKNVSKTLKPLQHKSKQGRRRRF